MKKRWNKEEDKQLLDQILLFTKNGNSIREAANLASEKIDRSFESCYARWNNFLRIEHGDKLEIARLSAKENGNIFYEKWSDEDDDQLTDMILDEVAKGISTRKAIDKSSKKINRSFTSCYNRWQNVLSKKFTNKMIYKESDSDFENNDSEELKQRVLFLEKEFKDVKEQNEKIMNMMIEINKKIK